MSMEGDDRNQRDAWQALRDENALLRELAQELAQAEEEALAREQLRAALRGGGGSGDA